MTRGTWAAGLRALAVALLVVLGSVATGSQAMAQVPALPGDPRVTERLEGLVTRAAKMRSVGVIEAGRINEFFGRGAVLDLSLPGVPDAEAQSALWSFFFRGSQIYHGRLAGNAVVGFYNPYVDGWLLTEWDSEDPAHPVMVSAAPALGEMIRAPGSPDLGEEPRWMAALGDASLPAALQRQAVETAQAFAARHPLAAATSPDLAGQVPDLVVRRLLMRRLAALLAPIVELQDTPVLAQAFDAVAAALRKGDREAITDLMGDAADPAQIDRMLSVPPEMRGGLVPLAVLGDDARAVVLSANPSQARFVVVSRVAVVDGTARITALGGIDVFAESR